MKRHSRHGDRGLSVLSLRNYLIISISYFDVKTVILGLYAAKKYFVTNIEVFCRNNSERWRFRRPAVEIQNKRHGHIYFKVTSYLF